MRFLIYGAGAVGQALGCMLNTAGHQVDLLLRERFIPQIRQTGLQVDGVFGSFHATAAPDKDNSLGLYADLNDIPSSYDYVLVTTKSYDTEQTLEALRPLQDRITTFVSMQNGCGNIEQFMEAFGAERVLGGRIITGFEIISAGQVKISVSADALHIGNAIPQTPTLQATELAEALSQAGHPTKAVDNIYTSLFDKLLYNCALNPLGAVLGTHYGPLGDMKETRELIQNIINETYLVISAEGGTVTYPDAASYGKHLLTTLLPATYNHRPSMLQDLEQGKKTEIDSLAGYVSRRARTHGIATPTCDMLTALIRFRERQNEKNNSPHHG